jgi:hypothetical protein
VTTAFDAIRATLDFNPWTLDFAYAKITENNNNPEDDLDLYIANVNYKFAEYNAVAEGYLISEADRATLGGTGIAGATGTSTHNLGGRIQFDPISQITLGGELAYQFGEYHPSIGGVKRDRSAWMFDVFGTYRWDYTWKPEVTLEYVLFQGEDELASTGEYSSWNPMYRGKFWTAIADFREVTYGTADPNDQAATTNTQFIQIKGSIKPLEDLMMEASWTYLWTDESIVVGGGTRSDGIGWELDLQTTYDYTEDVSFGMLTAWFVPGDYYTNNQDETASQVLGSVKVTF